MDLVIRLIGKMGIIEYKDGTYSRFAIENDEGMRVLKVYGAGKPLGRPIGIFNMKYVVSVQTIPEMEG